MSAPAPLGPIHHVGYVVADLDAGVAAFGQAFAAEVTHREVMEDAGGRGGDAARAPAGPSS